MTQAEYDALMMRRRHASPTPSPCAVKHAPTGLPCRSEHEEQVEFFRWIDEEQPNEALKELTWAIPNGGARHITTAKKLKAEGVRPGVPDINVAIPIHPYHGLYLEMKRVKGGKVSSSQKRKRAALISQGYRVVIAKGCAEAIAAVKKYMGMDAGG